MRRLFALTASIAFACSADPTRPSGGGNMPDPMTNGNGNGNMNMGAKTTYHEHVRPIVETSCLGCHVDGGIGPFALDTFDAVKLAGPAASKAVGERRMPPWLPDPDCRRFQSERRLADEDVATIQRWVSEGMEAGDPADYKPRSRNLTFDWASPTATIEPLEAYQPNSALTDDYRCFPLPHRFDRETYLYRANVVPDQRDMVHHVIVFIIGPDYVAELEAQDLRDPGSGYTCFGGPGVGVPQLAAGWAPGLSEPPQSVEAAVRIPAGSRLVMQMHYNLLDNETRPDKSKLELWTSEERPQWLVDVRGFANFGIDIAPGAPTSRHVKEFNNGSGEAWIIAGTSPHMHTLGTKIRTSAIAADGRETCLVDIPRWDFHWQQGYSFLPGETVVVQPGEKIRLECEYDNSAENQPIVNGNRRDPARVTWGEGTLDEMCLNYLWLVKPWSEAPDPSQQCGSFQGCYDLCRTNPFGYRTSCSLSCGSVSGRPCVECVLGGLVQCAIPTCPKAIESMLNCLDECSSERDVNGCVTRRCADHIITFDNCVDPLITAGTCQAASNACNVRL